jgi:trimeric autotransporter adhesin
MTTMLAFLKQHGLRVSSWLAVCAVAVGAAAAQAPAARITQNVDDSSRVTLKNGVSSMLRSASDHGAVAGSTAITNMRLVLSRTDEQTAALDTYLAELQQKSSPNYHKWLTPAQFGERFGAASSDIDAITSWLETQGFTNISVDSGRTSIAFSGTAATVAQAFRTSIHSFSINGRQFTSNITNPSIPSALAAVVSGVAHLNSTGPRSFSHPGIMGQLNPETNRLEPINTDAARAGTLHSDLTTGSSGSYSLYLVPGDAATIYNTPNSFNANFSTSTSYTGTGVTIGIIGDALVSTTPIANYRSLFLGDTTTVPTIIGSTTSTSDADEAYLDLEVSGGLAPGANLRFYTGSDGSLATQITTALTDNLVDILSVSFGLCEQDMTTADNATYSGYWQQAAAQGIAVTVSTGDSGSAGCDSTSTSGGANTTAATGGLGINGLASSPYNIAVGGTDFQLTQANFGTTNTSTTYVSTTNSSTTHYRTALKYIPEMVWNDSTNGNTTISANVPWTATTSIKANIVAGSGGFSSCSVNTTSTTVGTCTSGHAKPSWQRGTGVPSDSARDIPDVSLMAGVDYFGAWLVCTNDTSQGITANCASSGSSFYFYGFGGTSAAAPAFAGILALTQQAQGGGRLGQAAANLYNLYNNGAAAVFHDTTVGNNSVPCTSGTPNCVKNAAGNYFESDYDSTTGYDLASGLGSVDATAMISNWASGMGSATATVTATPAATSIDVTEALSVSVAVTGGSGTPTGSVSITSGSYTSAAANLDGGIATVIIPSNSLAVGADTLTVNYTGDGVYSATTGSASVTVTSALLQPSGTTLATSATTTTYGTSVTLTATVTPAAATGTVYFYDGTVLLGSGTVSSGTAAFSTSTLGVSTHTITASYSGDATYAGSTSTAVTVTVSNPVVSAGSFTLTATNITASQGSSGSSTVTVTPVNSYTGTVGFTLSTSSTSLQTNGCYAINNASVTGTTAVTTTLIIYTSSSACSSVATVKKNAVKKFNTGASVIASANTAPTAGSNGLPYGLVAAAGVLLLGLRRRAKWITTLGCLLLLAGAGLAIGCGGGSSGSSSSGKVDKGTYSLTLDGADTTSSSIAASTTLTLTVN